MFVTAQPAAQLFFAAGIAPVFDAGIELKKMHLGMARHLPQELQPQGRQSIDAEDAQPLGQRGGGIVQLFRGSPQQPEGMGRQIRHELLPQKSLPVRGLPPVPGLDPVGPVDQVLFEQVRQFPGKLETQAVGIPRRLPPVVAGVPAQRVSGNHGIGQQRVQAPAQYLP